MVAEYQNRFMPLWETFIPMMSDQALPHSILIVAPAAMQLVQWAKQFIAHYLCQVRCERISQEPNIQCDCSSCHWLKEGVHPDVHWIHPETPQGPLKIESIRALSQRLYQTTELGQERFVVIHPAQQLNESAANALLKCLEEPPNRVVFLLLAEQMGTLPATLISRCQRYTFNASFADSKSQDIEQLADSIREVIHGNITVCTAAERWGKESLGFHVLPLFYQLIAQLLQLHALSSGDQAVAHQTVHPSVQALVACTKPQHLWATFNVLQENLRQLQKKVVLNPLLVLETLFLTICYATRI